MCLLPHGCAACTPESVRRECRCLHIPAPIPNKLDFAIQPPRLVGISGRASWHGPQEEWGNSAFAHFSSILRILSVVPSEYGIVS